MADQRINQSEQADLATTNLAETTNPQRTANRPMQQQKKRVG